MVNGFQDDLIETVELDTAVDEHMEPLDRHEPAADERLHPGGGPIQKTYHWPVVFQFLMILGYFGGAGLALVGLTRENPVPLGFWVLVASFLIPGALSHLVWTLAKKRFPVKMAGLTARVLPVTVNPNPRGISFLPPYDIDDKRWRVESDSDVRNHLSFWGVMAGGFGFIMIAAMWSADRLSDPYLGYYLLAGVVGLGMFVTSYVIKPSRFIVFDRERGLMTYPRSLFKPWAKDRVVNLWECEGRTIRYTSRHGLMSYNMDLVHRPTQSAFMLYRNAASEDSLGLKWNVLLWYMDNHLPLPPVPGLEPYQDAEWEQAIARMKRRGSVIQTPMTISNQTLFEIGVVDEHGRPKSSQ